MKTFCMPVAVTALAMALAACGSKEGASQDQAPTENQAGAMTAESSNPFAQAEMQMSERMMAAVGTDTGDTWAKKMIEHHQGAIDMSKIVLGQNAKPDVAMMAEQGIEKQQKDIDDIRKILKGGAASPQSGDLYRPAMMEMQQKMEAAKGADVSETFMRKMLEHHEGAVAMSDVALKNGVTGAVRAQVQKTRDENMKEAKMVGAMLRGESHEKAMADSGVKSAAQAKAEPAPADKAQKDAPASKSTMAASKAALKPPTKPAAPAADPHAGMDMNNM